MSDYPDREILAEGRYIRAVRAQGWEWVERVNASGAAVIVAITAADELVLIEQFRVPLGCSVIELPAGLAGDGAGEQDEAHIEAARRELLEETGFEATDWRHLTDGPSSAGLATEIFSLYLARNAHRVAMGGGDGSENIRVHVVPLAAVPDWLRAKQREGLMLDPKIFAGLYFAQQKPA